MAYFHRFLVFCFFLLLGACGGGGSTAPGSGSGSGTVVPSPPPVTPPPAEVRLTKVTLQSDTGDAIGLGKNYSYSLSDAKISVTNERNQLVVRVEGDETWTGVFQTGGAEQNLITAGMVANVPRYVEDHDWGRSGLTWFGEGRACSSSYGWFAVDNVKYQGPRVIEIKVRFERHCNGSSAALRGEITYYADDTTKPPPPVVPAPATLWRPADVGNTVGNYAYFESEEGDYVGLGKTYRYDQRNANIKVYGATNDLVISVEGNEIWSGELRAMYGATDLQPGYYPAVHGSRFNNPVKGGLSWTGTGRGCSKSTGWFVVDSVTVSNYSVTALDLRFEQHCEGRAAALRGVIHWRDPALMQLPPVVGNTAVGSWRAPAASLPASGNYLYMQGDMGDPLTKGLIDLQTNATASFNVGVQDSRLSFNVHGVHNWSGTLMPKPGQTQFAPGDYASLSGGAFTVSHGHYGYFDPLGWVVIDNISYAGGKIVALDLRLEALSVNTLGNEKGLLRGQLHWRADQPDNFPGPSQLVPELFWRPATNYLPAAGNYIYLESDRSDFVGAAPAYLYTPLDSMISVRADRNKVSVNVNGDERWSGTFTTMSNASQIQAGYYAGLENTEFSNPARGNFSWGGDGRGCNTATSGVVVDKAVYSGSQLVELRMRFEQHCENGPGAMRGEIHWSAYDTQQPAGPAPIPSGLWRAAATLPASGNYLYVQSDAGDPIGDGRTWLMTGQDTKFMAETATWVGTEAYFRFAAESTDRNVGYWNGDFQAMVGVKKFQVGVYDRVLRFPFHNTAFGGLNLAANGKGCNTLGGWFAVDKAVYSGDTLVALHARFEQHCEFQTAALRGELNWEAPVKTLSDMRAVLPGGAFSETASRRKWGYKER